MVCTIYGSLSYDVIFYDLLNLVYIIIIVYKLTDIIISQRLPLFIHIHVYIIFEISI